MSARHLKAASIVALIGAVAGDHLLSFPARAAIHPPEPLRTPEDLKAIEDAKDRRKERTLKILRAFVAGGFNFTPPLNWHHAYDSTRGERRRQQLGRK